MSLWCVLRGESVPVVCDGDTVTCLQLQVWLQGLTSTTLLPGCHSFGELE